MSDSNEVQYFHLPNRLKTKAGPRKRVDSESLFAEAEAKLAELTDDYMASAGADLARIQAALAAAEAEPATAAAHLETLRSLVHDMKGQGATFGYPLVTEIGQSLHEFLTELSAPREIALKIIGHHVDALSSVIKNDIQGDGGEVGREVISVFRKAVARLSD